MCSITATVSAVKCADPEPHWKWSAVIGGRGLVWGDDHPIGRLVWSYLDGLTAAGWRIARSRGGLVSPNGVFVPATDPRMKEWLVEYLRNYATRSRANGWPGFAPLYSRRWCGTGRYGVSRELVRVVWQALVDTLEATFRPRGCGR